MGRLFGESTRKYVTKNKKESYGWLNDKDKKLYRFFKINDLTSVL